MKNKEVEKLLDCSNCELKECITCDITYTDRKKIREYIEKLKQLVDLMAEQLAGLTIFDIEKDKETDKHPFTFLAWTAQFTGAETELN